MKRGIVLIVLIFSMAFAYSLEGSHIISNSEDWRDVYSTMLYAKLSGRPGSFLVSTPHGPILLNGINKGNVIGVVSSKDKKFVVGYPSIIRSQGFAGAEELEVDNANLELIEEPEISDIKKFIIVGDSYGYNAIAVAPYAVLTRSWVFFANRINIAEIDALLSRANPERVLIYGYVDREVLDTLKKYNPEIINTRDRFEDNIEIVKKYIEEAKKREKREIAQVTLTNGEFFEQEVINGRFPILFTGRQNVPEKIGEFLKNSNIKVGVLVGNELIQAATNIRRTTGISVMVKFARSARTRTSGVAPVQGLDLFPLPSPKLELSIESVRFNKANSALEVTYKSGSNVPMFLKGTITLESGGEKQRVGDAEPIYLAPDDFKTIVYPKIELPAENMMANVVTLFGEVPTSLDRQLEGNFNVSIIDVIDRCKIEIRGVRYVIQDEGFYVKVKNIGQSNCFVDIEFEDILINNIRQTLGGRGLIEVKSRDSENIFINQRMSPEDLEDNPFVNVVAYFGEREDSLVNRLRGKFRLEIDRFNLITFYMILISAIIAILIIIIFFLRRKKEEEW